ncbi:MAG: hypothetical protein ACD_73C00644G0003 [uncultured bacterium]|nr:MAG: hypothetical protein ACD_73C00644G0003 [uncultured bacterium]
MGFDFNLASLVSRAKHELGIMDAIPAGPVPPRLVEEVAKHTGISVPAGHDLVTRGVPVVVSSLVRLLRPAGVQNAADGMPDHYKAALARRLPKELDFNSYHLTYAALPKALQTHPLIKEIHDSVETLSIVELYLKIKGGLIKGSAFVGHYLRPLFESLGFEDSTFGREDLLATREARYVFPPSMFLNVNVRGLKDYEDHFFGKAFLGYEWEKSRLKALLDHIPNGAVVADWGGGKGVFAHELLGKRPDMNFHVVDLFSPEEIEDENGMGPLSAQELRQHQNISFTTADAATATLPEGQKADVIFSASLSPYLKDPLRLLAHMYNQLKVGGLLLTTIPSNMVDFTKDWQRARTITEQLAHNLRKMGVAVSTFNGGKTIAIERRDDREMNVLAKLRHAFLEHFSGINFDIAHYESVYEPHLGQWAELAHANEEIIPDSADSIQADEPLVAVAEATQVEPPLSEAVLANPLAGVVTAGPNIPTLLH